MTQWQPIETAPRDETLILAYQPHFPRLVVGRIWNMFDDMPNHVIEPWTGKAAEATHWMPLPEAPQ